MLVVQESAGAGDPAHGPPDLGLIGPARPDLVAGGREVALPHALVRVEGLLQLLQPALLPLELLPERLELTERRY